MKIIGLTGGIGSGKTIICQIFNHLGVPVYEADKTAHRLYEKPELIEVIREQISQEAIDKNGKVNRKKLGEIVFQDTDKLKLLNGVVHPLVQNDFKEWTDKHKGHAYVIKEVAILFESGSYKTCDKVITVSAPEELRIARIRERDHKSKSEIEQVMSTQLTEEDRISRSDYVIYNDEKQMVLPQVLKLHSIFNN